MSPDESKDAKALALRSAMEDLGLDAEVMGQIEELRNTQAAMAKGEKVSKVEKKYKSVTIERVDQGTITLPLGMSYSAARDWLTKMEKDEEQAVAVHYEFEAFALDGARAFWKAMLEIYGFVDTKPSWWSTTTMIQVEVAPGVFEPVPWGQMQPPGIDGVLETNMDFNGEVPKFIIHGEVRKKHEKAVAAIAALTRKNLKEKSIYKGQAISVNLAFMLGQERFNTDRHAPKFLDLRGIKVDDLILDGPTESQLGIEIWDRIEHTDMLKKNGIKIKHGVVLAGAFGTGKTLSAYVTALKCVENGWTFIYLSSADQLPVGLKFAKLFGRVVLFGEDIDRAVAGQTRTAAIDNILNAMDGVSSKNQEVIVVLTTNDVESVNQGFLRAGRTDHVIEFFPPDGPTSQRFIAKVLGKNLKAGEDLHELADTFAGVIPAFLSEAAGKAGSFAFHRTLRETGTGKIEGQVVAKDLMDVAAVMKKHIEMVTGKKADPEYSLSDLMRAAKVKVGDLTLNADEE